MLFDEPGITLSLPYNFQPDFIEQVLVPFANSTEEVYLSQDCFRCDWCKKHIQLGHSQGHAQSEQKSIIIARLTIENGPDFLVFELDSGHPVYQRAGRPGIAYQANKLTDTIEQMGNKLAKVLISLQKNKDFHLESLVDSTELHQEFKGLTVTLERKSLQPGSPAGAY